MAATTSGVVLIVDDDSALRTHMAYALDRDYRVRKAASGRECVRILQEDQVDIILLDMVMNDGDGYYVLGHVSRMHPSEKPMVIVLSVVDELRTVIGAMKLGADDYLVKPSPLGVIKSKVAEVLSRGDGQRVRRNEVAPV